MQKNHRVFLLTFVAILALLAGAFGTALTFAHGSTPAARSYTISASAASIGTVAARGVNMASVPAAPQHILSPVLKDHPTAMPLLTVARRKEALVRARNIPHLPKAFPAATVASPYTPATRTRFRGMEDSPTICPYFGGCQPPDMALAASPRWVLQAVNTSVAVYDTAGHIQTGWPKNSQQFFNIPNPPNNCDPAGPFTSDPRAFYDPYDGRFWVIMLQLEGAVGIAPNCPLQSLYWAAVSQTSDPNGAWNVYTFDMTLGTTNIADYTQAGFDSRAFYFGANMFKRDGSAYVYDEIFGVNKAAMESGASVTAYGFTRMSVNHVLVDTVQPVEGEYAGNSGPPDGLFINSFNINGDPTGNDCFTNACSGVEIWAMHSPGTRHASLSGFYVQTAPYVIPPNADEPHCGGCIETIDTRITATPPFAYGQISFALDTSVINNSQLVPGILWGQITPTFVNGILGGAQLYQQGYFGFQGDQDASFGALMPDANGNLLMVYDTMSSTLYPSTYYAARRVDYILGYFHDTGNVLHKGYKSTYNNRWGDYEATSFDGPVSDHIWFASQYAAEDGDWATAIGETDFATK